MQMLGEVFKEEVAANGGKLPPLGVKTLVRLAGRLWVKRKIFHGKQKLGGLFGIQVSVQLPYRNPGSPKVTQLSPAAPSPSPHPFTRPVSLAFSPVSPVPFHVPLPVPFALTLPLPLPLPTPLAPLLPRMCPSRYVSAQSQ